MKLLPYQKAGAAFLTARRFGLLADKMGLGKSAQTIRALDMIAADDVLVLCPAAVRDTWCEQFEHWSPIPHRLAVIEKARDSWPDGGIVICSYDLALHKRVYPRLRARRYDVLVLDEAHFLKNRAAQRTLLIYGQGCAGPGGLAELAERVWCVTGTPMLNDPTELWPMLRLFGVCTKDYWSFTRTFTHGLHTRHGYKVSGVKNPRALRALLQPVMLRRRLEDVELELPALTITDRRVTPADPPKALFASQGWCLDPKLAERELNEQTELVLGALARVPEHDWIKALEAIAPAVSSLRRYVGLAKVTPASALIRRTLDDRLDDKLVVYAYHRDVIKLLKATLDELKPLVYWGGMGAAARRSVLRQFLTEPRRRLLIAQLQAAGTGLDGLQRVASTVFLLESAWTPSANAQAIMRVHRGGQRRPVRAYFITANHTIDTQINRVLRRKTEMLAKIVE